MTCFTDTRKSSGDRYNIATSRVATENVATLEVGGVKVCLEDFKAFGMGSNILMDQSSPVYPVTAA